MIQKNQKSIGISSLSYAHPKRRITLRQLENDARLRSKKSVLQDFGFDICYEAKNSKEFTKLLKECAEHAIKSSNLSKEEIKFLLLYRGVNYDFLSMENHSELAIFRYLSTRLHYELNLPNANAITLSEQGCCGLLTMINLGYHYLNSSGEKAVLGLAGDFLPHGSKREVIYNLMSDAACGFILQTNSPKNKIVGYHQTLHSYYWDTPDREDELLASYFPIAERTIKQALVKCGLKVEDVDWFIPHNVSKRSWEILAKLINIPQEKIWTENIAHKGHTVTCDHIINLFDMEHKNLLKKGDILALFTFGFGAIWSCMIIKH